MGRGREHAEEGTNNAVTAAYVWRLRRAEHEWSLISQRQAERLSQALDGLPDSSDLDLLTRELSRRMLG